MNGETVKGSMISESKSDDEDMSTDADETTDEESHGTPEADVCDNDHSSDVDKSVSNSVRSFTPLLRGLHR